MPHSAMESIRRRLESTRRRQNMSLALAQLGRWLLSCSLLFVLVGAIGSLFNLDATAWKAVFIFWVVGVFLITFYLVWHFLAQWQSARHFAHSIEERLPELEQRLITSLEFGDREAGDSSAVSQQFIDKLFEDAQSRVEAKPLNTAVSFKGARNAFSLAGLSIAGVVGLLVLSESFMQATRQLAWPWAGASTEVEAAPPPVAIHVEPGDVSMQRGDDMTVVASLDNASSDQLVLYVQEDHVNWRQLTMTPEGNQPADDAKVFSTDVRQLSEDLVYYVEYRDGSEAGGGTVRSPQYRVRLFDLPRVDDLELTFEFPDYTGMENKTENPGGDVVAPEGTNIRVTADLNKKVKDAKLVFDDGDSVPLSIDDRKATGSFQVSQDTNYRIELIDENDYHNRNPSDYYIRAIQDRAPEISLRAPGKDQRVMPLEEVAIEVNAEDDYGLTQFELAYSVVGTSEENVDFLEGRTNRKSISGDTLLYLEDLEVKPGDIISYSVTVRDNNDLTGPNQVVSDIYFLEVIPTDHRFSRARGGGGGGGGQGGGSSSALITTQKDVIAATWKLRNRKDKADQDAIAEDGQIIRDSQAEVAQRAQMSIDRLTERGNFAEDNYQNAVVALRQAIEEMQAAVESLDELALPDALASEQRALQAIMQAESQINSTEIAMNRNGGGGGGGGQQREQEELRELFEMEMGELENRYELPQQQSGQNSQAQNETLDKLKELARRQERLTRSQRDLARREEQMDEEQRRRQLEQLRREQEELRRQVSELSQSMQRSGQRQSASQSNPSGEQGGSGNQSQAEQQQRQQAQRLEQAMEQMQQASESESPSQAAAKSQKALDSLRQQAEQMNAGAQQSMAELQEAIKERSDELVRRQRQLRQSVEEKSREQGLGNSRSENARAGGAEEIQQMQSEQRDALDQLGRDLRDIATRAGDDQERELREAHEISQSLRPIREKMNTSSQIVDRGMLNLSLKLEGDVEAALADLQREIQSMGTGRPGGSEDGEQVADQVRQLRESLEQLQEQVDGQSGSGQQPEQLSQRRGERSGAGQQEQAGSDRQQSGGASRRDMQESLQRSRELARGLAQMGAGGQAWSGNARSVRSELSRQDLEEFLSRPELLQELLAPIIELENELRVQAELNQIDNKLYSALEEEVPEQYKSLVESYYRVLSESKTSGETAR